MPCGWKCGARLTCSEMRKHFTGCPNRPERTRAGDGSKSTFETELEHLITNKARHDLFNSLKRSEEYRHAFIEESIHSRLTAQIKSLREGRAEPWSYPQLAHRMGKKVSWVYRLEDPNASLPTIPTLLEVARAFDVALDVRFVPFSKIAGDVAKLTDESLKVQAFIDDISDPVNAETA